MIIETINTLKAKRLYGKKKGKLVIAGCKTIAESYGFFLDVPDKPTLCVYFNYKMNKWIIVWALKEKPIVELDKNVSNKDFIAEIEKFIQEK